MGIGMDGRERHTSKRARKVFIAEASPVRCWGRDILTSSARFEMR